MTIDPSNFLNDSTKRAMQTAKRGWHQILADGGTEGEAAIAMMARAIEGICGFDQFMAGRIAIRLMSRAPEVLFDIAIDDAKEAGLPYEAMVAARDKAIAERVASEETAPADRPKPTLVPDPAND